MIIDKNKNNPDTHPKVYIALNKAEIEELKQKVKESVNHNNKEKAAGIQEAIDWIIAHDIYTRPWTK